MKLLLIALFFAFNSQSLFCQVTIDSFVNIVRRYRMPIKAEENKEINKQDKNVQPVEIFRVKEVTPAIMGCFEIKGELEIIQCTEEQLSIMFFRAFNPLSIDDKNHLPKRVQCKLQIDEIGIMEGVEVITTVDQSIKDEIVRIILLLEEEGIRWLPQKARGNVKGVNVYYTIDFEALLDNK
ncbi:MAG: hypothetical protein MI974_32870 [Chitinophagales bacterium]|nr:hypothetical protein [Chitinophagales bacterium]